MTEGSKAGRDRMEEIKQGGKERKIDNPSDQDSYYLIKKLSERKQTVKLERKRAGKDRRSDSESRVLCGLKSSCVS